MKSVNDSSPLSTAGAPTTPESQPNVQSSAMLNLTQLELDDTQQETPPPSPTARMSVSLCTATAPLSSPSMNRSLSRYMSSMTRSSVATALAVGSGRTKWAKNVESPLSLMGFVMVGYGNVWRFPYLVYMNGGSAIFIPYVIFLLLVGIPMVYLEMSVGQFSSFTPIDVYTNMAPIFQGIGWAMLSLLVFFVIFYNVIVAWSIFYTFASISSIFTSVLPWVFCGNNWNTDHCYSEASNAVCALNGSFGNESFYYGGGCHSKTETTINQMYEAERRNGTLKSSAEQFFYLYLYQRNSEGVAYGSLQWHLSLCLLAAWILTCLCVVNNARAVTIAIYGNTFFPFLVLAIFLFASSWDGGQRGLEFIKPNFSVLASPEAWVFAASQVLFSLSVGFGSLTTFSSNAPFDNNFYRNVLIICTGDTLTSLLAVFAIFYSVGVVASKEGVEVDNIIGVQGSGGTSLVFVAMAQAMGYMPWSTACSILFFFMFVTMGLSSQTAAVECLVTLIIRQIPQVTRFRSWVILVICISMYLLSLPMCVQRGYRIFGIFNDYIVWYAVLYLGLAEAVCCIYIYGVDRLLSDVAQMLVPSNKLFSKIAGATGWYWRLTFLMVTPAALAVATVATIAVFAPFSHQLYTWREGLFGWTFTFVPLFIILLMASIKMVRSYLALDSVSLLFCPTDYWCPAKERLKFNPLCSDDTQLLQQ